LEKLNDRQREAIHHSDGPVLVLAGAGSGKTRVIAYKIAHLIDRCDVEPAQIAAITFTNKAAREMRERVHGLLGGGDRRPWISTFHRLGLEILGAECAQLGYRPGFSIFDAADCAGLLSDLLRRDQPGSDIPVERVQQCISAWKFAMVRPQQVMEENPSPAAALAARCYAGYCDALMTYNAVDFDDLIMRPVELLRADEGVLGRWRERIDCLLVDEYQDTNSAQYELVKLLVGQHQRLTAVGDDDQSIYGWRGAQPENMQQLAVDFPRIKVIKLEQNYRCSGIILNAANALIANNPHVHEKRLWSEHGFGDKIRVIVCKTEHDESERIANDILHRRLLHGYHFSDFAVLLRGNHQARLFEHAFRERDIPYVLSGGRSFFDYAEVKDCVCYLRLLANPSDDNALLRVINTPRRAIGPQTVKILVETAAATKRDLVSTSLDEAFAERVSPQVLKRVRRFTAWLRDFQQQAQANTPADAFAQLLKDISYDDWLEQGAETEQDAERRKDNVAELVRWIKRIHNADSSRTIADVVAALTLFDIADRQEADEQIDGVQLATLHAAKGLEYPHVFLAGFEENLLPHRSSIDDGSVEEERRLAYVGITRAKRTLSITFSRSRKRYGQIEICEPSRFLEELPAEELAWGGDSDETGRDLETGRGTLENLKRMLKT
jgi:ATP-dependent DNA helicase Rep